MQFKLVLFASLFAENLCCTRQYLPIFIYELATDMNTLKFERSKFLLEKESLIRLCRRDFVLFIYACIFFSTSFVRQKQHNFNTNLFMFWCCKMSSQINLEAFLKLQSTSLVAFCFNAKVGNLTMTATWEIICVILNKLPLPALQFTHKIRFNKMCLVNEEVMLAFKMTSIWVRKYDWQHAMRRVEKVRDSNEDGKLWAVCMIFNYR